MCTKNPTTSQVCVGSLKQSLQPLRHHAGETIEFSSWGVVVDVVDGGVGVLVHGQRIFKDQWTRKYGLPMYSFVEVLIKSYS